MDSTSASPQFEDFWEASGFSQYNIGEFARNIENYSGTDKPELALKFSSPDYVLSRPKGSISKIASLRKSSRTFKNQPLTERSLSELLASFRATDGLEHRAYPSAGAAYPLEIFMLTLNVKGDLHGKILYYNADNHSVAVVSVAPSWRQLEPLINLPLKSPPQCILVFVLMTERMTVKYAERGGRFALVEVGAALQNVCLTVAEQKLKGVPLGGY